MLIDTDMLSARAQIGQLHLLFALLLRPQLYITPGVFGELAQSFKVGRQYANLCRLKVGEFPASIPRSD